MAKHAEVTITNERTVGRSVEGMLRVSEGAQHDALLRCHAATLVASASPRATCSAARRAARDPLPLTDVRGRIVGHFGAVTQTTPARIDVLTDLSNRRQLQASLDAAVAIAHRHGQSLYVLMIDVDHFKDINDNHGHNVGDEVLRFVAHLLRDSLRAGDLVGRWGGEEFLALLPCTDHNGAQIVAERLRQAISSTAVVIGDQLIPVSVSIGAAALDADHTEALIVEADAAMYAAKAAGRDRVRVAH